MDDINNLDDLKKVASNDVIKSLSNGVGKVQKVLILLGF